MSAELDRLDRLEGRLDGVVGDVRDLRREVRDGFDAMAERFDTVDEAHEIATERAGRVDWKTIIAFAATVVVPILIAFITRGAT